MFNTRLLEVVSEPKSSSRKTQHNDSFSSGSDPEDGNGLRRSLKNQQSHHHSRKRKKPHRAIPHEFALTGDQKAQAGIFVVDPFHCRINLEFLKAFAAYHGNATTTTNSNRLAQNTYFSSSGDEDDELAALELNYLAPDMSHMGFTTSSGSEGEHSHNSTDFWDDSSVAGASANNHNSGKTSKSHPKKKAARTSTFSGVNSSKIVNSSSIPRSADNSANFPEKLSQEAINKLVAKISTYYKSYPQNQRHGSTPMDISACPGVKLLSEEEYLACSLLRIRPALFFHARNTLLHNFHHSVGYFRKSAAQKMLRIDVNKTGKLYDFLVKQNWIPQEENGQCKAEPEKITIDDPETYHQL